MSYSGWIGTASPSPSYSQRHAKRRCLKVQIGKSFSMNCFGFRWIGAFAAPYARWADRLEHKCNSLKHFPSCHSIADFHNTHSCLRSTVCMMRRLSWAQERNSETFGARDKTGRKATQDFHCQRPHSRFFVWLFGSFMLFGTDLVQNLYQPRILFVC